MPTMAHLGKKFKDFGDWLWGQGVSAATLRGYLLDVERFCEWYRQMLAVGDPKPADVTASDLRDYHDSMGDKSTATIARRFAALRKWLTWGLGTGQIDQLPRFPKIRREQCGAPKSLTRLEQNALLRAVEKGRRTRDIAIVRLLLGAGLRVSELVRLQSRDIEIRERSGIVRVVGKGDKARDVPLGSEARHAIRQYFEHERPESWFFPGRGRHIATHSVGQILAKYAYQARLEKVTPHRLRHSFAMNLINAGVDLVKVAALLGHERLETTAIYTRPRVDELAAAVERAEAL